MTAVSTVRPQFEKALTAETAATQMKCCTKNSSVARKVIDYFRIIKNNLEIPQIKRTKLQKQKQRWKGKGEGLLTYFW